MATKNRFEPTAYEKKIAELRGEISKAAKELQGVVEERDSVLREVKSLGERKSRLRQEIIRIESEVREANERLENSIERGNKHIESFKRESNIEKQRVETLQGLRTTLEKHIETLTTIAHDYLRMHESLEITRNEYISAKDALDAVQKEEKEISEGLRQRREYLDKKDAYLNEYYEKLKMEAQKLNGFASIVQDNVRILNEMAGKENLNLLFGLPPDQIIEVPYDINAEEK